MNVVAETGKVAVSAVSGLSSMPAILALVLLQFAFITGSGYLTFKRDAQTDRRFRLLLQHCLTMSTEEEKKEN